MYAIILKSNENLPYLYYNIETGGYTEKIEYATKIKYKEIANIVKDSVEMLLRISHEVVKL